MTALERSCLAWIPCLGLHPGLARSRQGLLSCNFGRVAPPHILDRSQLHPRCAVPRSRHFPEWHMILSAILLFALVVLLGLSMVIMGLRYQRGSLALGLSHATVAVLALVLLAVGIFRGPTVLLYNDAALLFALTLVGGLVLLALREGRGRRDPRCYRPSGLVPDGCGLHARLRSLEANRGTRQPNLWARPTSRSACGSIQWYFNF